MADTERANEKADDSAVKVYARVRQILPWEEQKLGIKWTENTVQNYGLANASKEYKFTEVLAPEMDNEVVFDNVLRPLIQRVLDGYNSLVIAYGQTGAGKTYTLLGKPKLGVTGMLSRSLVEFLENPDVKKITVKAVEAYGVKPQRIDLFDLLNEQNSTGNWSEKKGNSRLQIETDNVNKVEINTKEDCFEVINRAQQASHFAPTGKNPESSRGHVVFVVDVQGENSECEVINSSMIFADLAGSEGDSALTAEFAATVTPETLLARKLEGGVINVGLSELQLVFRDLMTKGKLSRSTGTGLIRMIKPYINKNTFISVCFCLSPSFVNCASTEATLKFAAQACKLKTTPARAEKRVNYEKLSESLKEDLREKEEILLKFQEVIRESLMEGNHELQAKLLENGLLNMFDVETTGLQRKVTSRLDRSKSMALLQADQAEEDEKSWHVNRRKHRRMFSKHINENALVEFTAQETLREHVAVMRNDEEMVQEMMEEAERDHATRAWLAVIGSSLANTGRKMRHRLTVFGDNVEMFFKKVARAVTNYRNRSNNSESDEEPEQIESYDSRTDLDEVIDGMTPSQFQDQVWKEGLELGVDPNVLADQLSSNSRVLERVQTEDCLE